MCNPVETAGSLESALDATLSSPPDLVPSSNVCISAYQLAHSVLPQSILFHSLRVYRYCQRLGEIEKSSWGADAAAELLRQFDVPEHDVREVWQAIALHTSPGIAERISTLARLLRLGPLIDFVPESKALVGDDFCDEVEIQLPRLEIEKVLGDAVVDQALEQRKKAPPASWPGIMLRSKLENPKWHGANKES